MLAIRRHKAADYSTLQDMELTSIGTLTAEDHACLDDLGTFLVANDMQHRFGISLLHRHFAVSDDEVFFESPCPGNRSLTLRPHHMGILDEQSAAAVNCLFVGSVGGASVDLVGLEYAALGELGGPAPIGTGDTACLGGIRAILDRHGRRARFGVALLHNKLGAAEDEAILETCAHASRSLLCRVVSRSDDSVPRSVETSWTWERSPSFEASMRCERNCRSYCNSYGSGYAHDSKHEPSHSWWPSS